MYSDQITCHIFRIDKKTKIRNCIKYCTRFDIVKYFTDCFKAVLLLCIICVIFVLCLSCFRVCSLLFCGRLTSGFLFVNVYCNFVTFPFLINCDRCGT